MDLDAIKKAFFQGKLKAYQLEEEIFAQAFGRKKGKWLEANRLASEWRLAFLEEKLGKKFPAIRQAESPAADEGKLISQIEQKIGGAVLPLGFAGPLRINGEHAKGEFYLPLATSESALIAGLNRGIKLINGAGGAKCVVTRDCMTRAPVLLLPSIAEANRLAQEVSSRGPLFSEMKKAAESESTVSKLLDIQPFQMGRKLWLRFVYQTGDSMGMNSATKYTANAIRVLGEKCPQARLLALSGNLCADKKAAHVNLLLGRGKAVEVEVEIPASLLKSEFDTTPAAVAALCQAKIWQGSALAGTFGGFNANVANTIAALYAACGQDLAQLPESSSAYIQAEATKDGLLINATFPNLELGTRGGGMAYGTARECLEMLGCNEKAEPGKMARKFAEIVAAAATAQDLNLLLTLGRDYELADAHFRLARGKK